MSNGVRNLRAMFENGNAAASPEPRGRSPTDGAAAADAHERPKSRVRASFVSVEPSGAHPPTAATDLGQTKGTPSNSVNATRRESFRVSQDNTDELAELKKVVSDEKEQRQQSLAIPEAVPEQAVASRESSLPAPPIREEPAADMPNLGSIMKGSDFPESSSAAAHSDAEVVVPAPEIDQIPVEDTPVATESAVEAAPVASPEPEPAPAQPAENPDKATTGAQDHVALRPAAPTEEAVVQDAKPALDEAAVDDDAVIAEENAIAAEAAEDESASTNGAPSAPSLGAAQPAENPDTAVAGEQEEIAPRPAAPTEDTAVADAPTTPSAPTEVAASSNELATETAAPAESKAKANGTPSIQKPEIKKPAAISTAKPTKAPAAPAKSPLPKAGPKTPTKSKTTASIPKPSPVKTTKPVAAPKPAAPKEPVKAPAAKAPATKAPAAKVPTAKTSRTSLRPAPSSSAATPTTAAAAAKTKPITAPVENKKPTIPKPITSAPRKSTSPTGFKKPAPKSPTRPVGLPSRLTAPTAASAAKHGEEPKVTRKPSTTTRAVPPKAAAPKTSRASLAPSAPKRPESRTSTTSAASKGGFLERMMRPTAASSSKTHDKPHEKASSPPRKAPVASKPSTLQKGKKVEEVAAKAKEVVTNGHSEEHKTEDEPAKEPEHPEQTSEESTVVETSEESTVVETPEESTVVETPEESTVVETSHEPEKAATPVPDVESSVAEIQTPNFQEETIR
ncbi:hypothetical protein G6011_05519 [Alternaria panax]|uniref:Mucin-7 n=1 Tax=Alternaria panax TaxID=48097 RepID=A0AAD4I6K4_9PLEO|nr:hypothetical protein G6011_05519 [Alternaria panax]